jgi:hypothetical protein
MPTHTSGTVIPLLALSHYRAEFYVVVHHISPPKSWNRVSEPDREVVTALEREGSRGCSAGRGGWSEDGTVKLEYQGNAMGMWLHVTYHIGVTTENDAA